MTALRRLLFAVACLLACSVPAAAQTTEESAAVAAAERQILVFLRMPPQHFRPGAEYGAGYGGEGRNARLRIARGLAQKYGVALVDGWPIDLLGVDCFVMTAPAGVSADEVAARVSRDPSVSWAEPMHVYSGRAAADVAHNDPLYRVQPTATGWRLAELHKVSTGRKVRVAVIDSMVEKTHPDLVGQVEASENFVTGRPTAPEQHGTSVAGIIAARSDNGVGIAGVAPDARLIALRACWQAKTTTLCDTLSLARALDAAIARRAQIINMSLSGPPDVLLGKLIDVAVARGIIVVGAFDRDRPRGGFPASHAGVVAVVDEGGGRLANVVSAPGRDVPAPQTGGRWFLVSGSSYAAAQVSGLFALLREREPALRTSALLTLVRSGEPIDACTTLMQRSRPCDGALPREILASFPK